MEPSPPDPELPSPEFISPSVFHMGVISGARPQPAPRRANTSLDEVPPPPPIFLPSSSPSGLCPELGPGPPALAAGASTCQVCFSRNGGGLGAMKPAPAVTLWWVLLLASRLGATRKGSPEEASFYYGTFPLGMSIPLLVCPSACQLATLASLPTSFVF